MLRIAPTTLHYLFTTRAEDYGEKAAIFANIYARLVQKKLNEIPLGNKTVCKAKVINKLPFF